MIRRATAADTDWIRDTAAHVYAALGDYGRVIPNWMAHSGVVGFVEAPDDASERPRGFILLGFYSPRTEAERREVPQGALVGDLLAIAVAPEFQRQGVGTTLLAFAIDFVFEASSRAPVHELRLTVADTNITAQALFGRHGFEVIDPHHGAYDGGQRAIRMRRRVRQPT